MKNMNKQSIQNTICNIIFVAVFLFMAGFACFSLASKVNADDSTKTSLVANKHYDINQIRLSFYDESDLIVESVEYEGDAEYNSSTSNNAIVKFLFNKSIKTDYTGKIAVSYDLSEVVVEESTDGIVVTLPEASIYFNEVKFTNCKSDDAIFTSDIKYSDFEKLENKIEESELQQAIDDGLYDRAQVSVEKVITDMVEEITAEEVKVTFQYM